MFSLSKQSNLCKGPPPKNDHPVYKYIGHTSITIHWTVKLNKVTSKQRPLVYKGHEHVPSLPWEAVVHRFYCND